MGAFACVVFILALGWQTVGSGVGSKAESDLRLDTEDIGSCRTGDANLYSQPFRRPSQEEQVVDALHNLDGLWLKVLKRKVKCLGCRCSRIRFWVFLNRWVSGYRRTRCVLERWLSG